jgi:hypothetical protein
VGRAEIKHDTQNMKLKLILQVFLSLFLLAAMIGLISYDLFYKSGIVTGFYPYVFASVVFIHLRVRFRWSDVCGILFVGALLVLLDMFVFHPTHVVILLSWVSFLGMASLVVMGLRAIWSQGEERRLILLAFIPGVLILASNHFAAYLHLWTEKARPEVLDAYLYSFDSSLHIPIAFLMGQAFAKWVALRSVSMVFYVGLPFTLAIVYAGQAARLGRKAIPIFVAFLIAGPVGGVFYNLFPALGPLHLFGEAFPWHPLPTALARTLFLEPVPIKGLRNAMPSLHMGWTLAAWWYSHGLSRYERGIAAAFVGFTVLATMGSGEHYFIDLIVAFPFMLFLQALCTFSLDWRDSRRLMPFLFGLFATLGWLVVLRYGVRIYWYSPLIPWAGCLGTVGLTEMARIGLKDAAVGNVAGDRMMSSTMASAVTEAAR